MLHEQLTEYLECNQFKLGTCGKHADRILALVRTALLSEASVEAAQDKYWAMEGGLSDNDEWRAALAAAIDAATDTTNNQRTEGNDGEAA